MLRSLDNLQTHAAVMIGTFPETGLVVNGVERTIGMTAPMPLSILPVDKL